MRFDIFDSNSNGDGDCEKDWVVEIELVCIDWVVSAEVEAVDLMTLIPWTILELMRG